MLRRFASYPGVTEDHLVNLTSVVTQSRRLAQQLEVAVRSGQLRDLVLLPAGTHIGGCYDGNTLTVSLPIESLEPRQQGELAFVLGHELQHALNMPGANDHEQRFLNACEHAACTTSDFTSAIEAYIAYQRTNEATANLAGWNALAEHVRAMNPRATINTVAWESRRARDFVTYTAASGLSVLLKPGLTINPDLSFDPSPANIEAMARYYFDKSPKQTAIGDIGTSDYRNDYGTWAVMQAAAFHRYFTRDVTPPPPMIINLTQLGLSRQIMEENGIDLEGLPAQPYLDCTTSPPQLDYLHHTMQTHRYVPAEQAQPRPAPDPSVDLARQTRPPTDIGRASPTRAPTIAAQDAGLRAVRPRVLARHNGHLGPQQI